MKGSAILSVLAAGLTPFLIITLIVVAVPLGLVAWKPPILWGETFGTSTGDSGASLIAADSTNLYAQGYMNSSDRGLPGVAGSLFLSTYSLNGAVIWTRMIGNTNTTNLEGISVGKDGIYMTGGESDGAGIVLKENLTGSQVWTRQFSPGTGEGKGISVTSTGVYVTGVSDPLTNQSFTGGVMFVRRYDFAGNVVWTNEFSNSSGGTVEGLYASSSGIYILAEGSLPGQPQSGSAFLVKYDLSGNQVWTRQLEADESTFSIAGDDTGVYIAGEIGTTLYVLHTGFVSKYSLDGNLEWTSQTGPPDNSGVGDSIISVDSSGVYYSISTSGARGYLLKYDLQGELVWTLEMQSPQEDYGVGRTAYRIAADNGSIYFAGSESEGSGSFHLKALVGELSPSPSLVFFGLNPPLSFVVVGMLVVAAGSGLFFFRRIRRRKMRPSRVGPVERSLPASD